MWDKQAHLSALLKETFLIASPSHSLGSKAPLPAAGSLPGCPSCLARTLSYPSVCLSTGPQADLRRNQGLFKTNIIETSFRELTASPAQPSPGIILQNGSVCPASKGPCPVTGPRLLVCLSPFGHHRAGTTCACLVHHCFHLQCQEQTWHMSSCAASEGPLRPPQPQLSG